MSTATPPQNAPTPSQVLVGRTFRMMREAHHVKQSELAAMVGVSKSHLSRVESGEREASADLHEKINAAIESLPALEVSA